MLLCNKWNTLRVKVLQVCKFCFPTPELVKTQNNPDNLLCHNWERWNITCTLTPSLPQLCITSNHVEKQSFSQDFIAIIGIQFSCVYPVARGRMIQCGETYLYDPKSIATMHTFLSEIIFATSRVLVWSKRTSGGKITVTCSFWNKALAVVRKQSHLHLNSQCCRSACGVYRCPQANHSERFLQLC